MKRPVCVCVCGLYLAVVKQLACQQKYTSFVNWPDCSTDEGVTIKSTKSFPSKWNPDKRRYLYMEINCPLNCHSSAHKENNYSLSTLSGHTSI